MCNCWLNFLNNTESSFKQYDSLNDTLGTT